MENNGNNGNNVNEAKGGSGFDRFKARAGEFLQKRGIYLVLIVCLGIVGVSAFFALSPLEQGGPDGQGGQGSQVGASDDQSLAEAMATPTPSPTPALTPSPSPTPSPTPVQIADFTPAPGAPETPASTSAQKAIPPVMGEVIWPFAQSELIYSDTLDQWMTHRGVDVAAKKGDEVYAPYAGVVDAVFEDDALGVCVTIAHADNLRTVYANLKEEPPVKEGQSVSARDVIGYIGDTAMAECDMASHLHFELYASDAAVDPSGYFTFEKQK